MGAGEGARESRARQAESFRTHRPAAVGAAIFRFIRRRVTIGGGPALPRRTAPEAGSDAFRRLDATPDGHG